ncbi:MAG: hypothetical protein ACLP7W_06005, partial [Solirubrobacteraceae bacterium]
MYHRRAILLELVLGAQQQRRLAIPARRDHDHVDAGAQTAQDGRKLGLTTRESITLSKGARAMARKKVIVKHLSAIQNFGSIDVLCSDKTGTLTSGSMALDRSLSPLGDSSERVFTLAYLNSKFQTGITSPLDMAILQKSAPEEAAGYEKRDEIPYDFERRRLSIVVERQSRRLLITKGAPE